MHSIDNRSVLTLRLRGIWTIAVVLAAAATIAGCAATPPAGVPARGRALYMQSTIDGLPGCITCHSPDPDASRIGPSHLGIASRAEQTLEAPGYSGAAQDVEGYLRESILEPDAFVREGFAPGVMPSRFAEVLDEQQVADLVAYLLTLD